LGEHDLFGKAASGPEQVRGRLFADHAPRGDAVTDVSLTILAETEGDAGAIERLHERTFGPGRYAKTAYRLREQVAHRLDLSFTGRIGTLLVGSVRLSPVRIGEAKALLLGPLTVEPPFRDRGVGQALIARALDEARAKGHQLVILVGDEPYYGKCGFKSVPKGRVAMPGPVDPERLLVAELTSGAFDGISGPVRAEWEP
jgi:predicted N-acetyltransferase YhbS